MVMDNEYENSQSRGDNPISENGWQIEPRGISVGSSLRLRASMGLPVGKHIVPNKPLLVNEELVWDNGTPYSEPCIDQIAETIGEWPVRMPQSFALMSPTPTTKFQSSIEDPKLVVDCRLNISKDLSKGSSEGNQIEKLNCQASKNPDGLIWQPKKVHASIPPVQTGNSKLSASEKEVIPTRGSLQVARKLMKLPSSIVNENPMSSPLIESMVEQMAKFVAI
ncbi:hypothetical protein ACH5RR_026150 [Cinchona calisaya]|uniref:Uncharacterized protein n=1 Tax=Cinchona calisaya TaxID=153742 RepID=A0ABD2Z1P3_9GENT